ncbi:MAG: hypothetical protein OEZ41_10865 [Nitrospirota bacterium]|nr:hypothetical protein [Nitrospirota bacterium]
MGEWPHSLDHHETIRKAHLFLFSSDIRFSGYDIFWVVNRNKIGGIKIPHPSQNPTLSNKEHLTNLLPLIDNTPLHNSRRLQESGHYRQGKATQKPSMREDLGSAQHALTPFRAEGKTLCGELRQWDEVLWRTPA